MKYCNWIVLVFLLVFLIQLKPKNRVYLTLIAVFFPLHLPILSFKGIMSTGTACIFFTYFLNLVDRIKSGVNKNQLYQKIIYIIIIIGAITTILTINDVESPRQSFKEYSRFIAALLSFLLIADLAATDENDKISIIEKIYYLFAVLLSIHIIISILQLKVPGFVHYLSIFDAYEFGEAGSDAIAKRIQDFIFSTESLGEITAVLIPGTLYFIFHRNKNSFLAVFVLFLIGLALTTLRSGLILFAFGFIMTFPYLTRKKPLKFILFLYFGVGLSFVYFWLNPDVITAIVYRFNLIDISSNKATFFAKINRTGFAQIIETYVMHPSIFGKGFVEPFHFHNLFFTIIYQIGIVGSFLYFSLLVIVFIKLVRGYFRSVNYKPIFFISLVSFMILLINECKYEFTRYESYYEICMFLLGGFALLGLNKQQNTVKASVEKEKI
jgi:hypothetical protein